MARILRPSTLVLLLVLLAAGGQGQTSPDASSTVTAAASSSPDTASTNPTSPAPATPPPSPTTASDATNAPADTPPTESTTKSTPPPSTNTSPTDQPLAPATVTAAAGSSLAPAGSSPAPAASTQAPTTVAPITTPPPAVADQVANLPLDLSTQTCGSMSCALGQMLADGVRTEVNRKTGTTKWTDAVRSVIIPAAAFAKDGALKAGALLQADLLKVLANKDEVVCKGELTVAALNDTLNRMLAAGTNDFPQVSGLLVMLDYEEGPAQVASLWAETELLDMRLLDPSDTSTMIKVALPCTYARDTMKIEGMQDTAVKLQDGLNALLPKDATDVLVPPVVQPRVRPHAAFPHQWDLCEDWTGMTVACE